MPIIVLGEAEGVAPCEGVEAGLLAPLEAEVSCVLTLALVRFEGVVYPESSCPIWTLEGGLEPDPLDSEEVVEGGGGGLWW